MKMEGFPSTWCPPRLVIPAHAGIQVCCAELAWIPAFAGMTEPRRASWFSSPNGYFQRRHEEHEGKKFKRRKRKEFHAVVAYAENQVVRPLSMKSNLDLARPLAAPVDDDQWVCARFYLHAGCACQRRPD